MRRNRKKTHVQGTRIKTRVRKAGARRTEEEEEGGRRRRRTGRKEGVERKNRTIT